MTLSLLRGTALQWYRIRAQRNPASVPTAYENLKASLLDQFAVINEGQKARDKLKTLQQTRSVYAYITAFEATALSIPDANDSELLHSFVWGLRDRIRQEVRFRNP